MGRCPAIPARSKRRLLSTKTAACAIVPLSRLVSPSNEFDLESSVTCRDDFKELLFDTHDSKDRAWSYALGGAAYELLWQFADSCLQQVALHAQPELLLSCFRSTLVMRLSASRVWNTRYSSKLRCKGSCITLA